MAQHGKHRTAASARKIARKVDDATVGTHVKRATSTRASGRSASSYGSERFGQRAADSHLDTLVPITESGEDGTAYRRRTGQARYLENVRKRARRRRVLTFLAAAIVVVGVAVVAGFAAFRGVVGSELALKDSDARDALSAPAEGEAAFTLFAVELGAIAEPLEQAGPDMIVLMREDRQANVLQLISLPPSLRVVVDNDTRRLADMAANGDAALISAVESYAKVDVNHFVKTDDEGLAAIVDALGGIDVTFDQVIDDQQAGDVYYPVGTYTLNGHGALTYLRATNLHMGKADQLANQTSFLKLVIDRLASYDQGFLRGVEAVGSYFMTDLALGELESFATWLEGVPDDALTCTVVPGYYTSSSDVVGDNGELYISKSAEFAELLEQLASGQGATSAGAASVEAADPASFTVQIWNGTDIPGAASTTADSLAAQGFRIADVGNAEQQVYDETLVVFRTRNTPKPATGLENAGEDGEGVEGADYEDPYADLNAVDQAQQTADTSQDSASAAQSEEQERALGQARAAAVVQALGMGRVVEGDMYYSFDADVLLVIGYDYKPVA